MFIIQPLLGVLLFVLMSWGLSEGRGRVRWQTVAIAFAAQFGLALIFLFVPGVDNALLLLNQGVMVLEEATLEATRFMFGFLAGGDTPYEVTNPGANVIIAFRVLPLILVVSALSAVLFHLRILPFVIGLIASAVQKAFRVSGPLAFAAASSIFLGIIESPLVIKPYLAKLRRDELFAVMVCGMATVAGTVMVLYASVLESAIPGALSHIVVASVISVPAALGFAHLLVPGETATDVTPVELERKTDNAMEALIEGTLDGLKMVVQIAAIIVVLFAIVNLSNRVLGVIPADVPVTLQSILGTLLRPVMWLIGIAWADTAIAGELFATKLILNEFVAYLQFGGMAEGLDGRSRLIMLYAMCGFANVGSLGILVGGLGSILPERRSEIIALGVRSILAGSFATLSTGAIVGVLS